MENPFEETFSDPLCKLNLKETSEFVKSLPMSSSHVRRERESLVTKKSNNVEAPCTPGRPIFSFSSAGNHLLQRKSFPSKWDDAGKWLNSSHDSPSAHHHHQQQHHNGFNPAEVSKANIKFESFKPKAEAFAEKPEVAEDMFTKAVSSIQVTLGSSGVSAASAHVLLKDKFTNEAEPFYPKYRSLEPVKEGFLFGNSEEKTEVVREVMHRDVGTEMTPIGSSTTSRCHTPFKSTSPARHNTPENRSGPLAVSTSTSSTSTTIDITHHLEKLHGGTQFDPVMASAWGSREEEEEDISKSLRHFEINNGCRRSVSESQGCSTWEEEEKNKCCLRYQREEARIQAWLNLQNAKAEAQTRKLEVKIQKMRSDMEEKIMKRMSVFHRKAEEWRAEAQLQHSEQINRMTKESQKKMMKTRQRSHFSIHSSCSCFPCSNNNHPHL